MLINTYTYNQRTAIELLGYKRWLLRDNVSYLQECEANDSALIDSTHTHGKINTSTKHIPTKFPFIPSPNTVAEAAVETEKPLYTSNHQQIEDIKYKEPLGKDSHFRVNNIDLYITPNITLFKWQSAQQTKTLAMALPPLWGANNELVLFQEQAECNLLINAMRTCGLIEIAEKLSQINEFINKNRKTFILDSSSSGILNTAQLIDTTSIVIIINNSLPALQAFQKSLQEREQATVITLTHPYFYLQQPIKKAELWHQLIHLQVETL